MINIKHFKYPEGMDEECIPMCDFFNTIGLHTKFSCCGHNVNEFKIIFADEVDSDAIRNFIEKISSKYDHTPLIGEFSMWMRKCDNKTTCNWTYSIPNNTLLSPPLVYADMDLTTMIARFQDENII